MNKQKSSTTPVIPKSLKTRSTRMRNINALTSNLGLTAN
jgi:hypothetical protein